MDRILQQGGLPTDFVSDVGDIAPLDERRKHQRYRANIAARCIIDGFESIEVVVIDISEGGFGLNCVLPVEQGTSLTILFPEVEMTYRASVVWTSATRCGLQLLPDVSHVTQAATNELALMLSKIANTPNQT